MYQPDFWTLLKFDFDGKIQYRVFGSWSGGYLSGDRWRMNSGIVSIEETDDHYDFIGNSGSIYRCHKNGYGANMFGASQIRSYKEQTDNSENITMEVLNEEQAFEYIKDAVEA